MVNPLKSETPISSNKVTTGTPVLIVSMGVNLVISFMTSSLNIALPTINREYQADAVSLTWVVTAYALAIATFSVPFSRIADIVGRKKIFILGAIAFTAISAITVFSNSIYMIIGCRSIQGISSAILQGTSIAMLTSAYPGDKRGRVLGLSTACVFFGQSIGPFLGGLLTEHLGWRSIFVVSVLTGLTLLLITIWKIKSEWIEARGAKFDYIGSGIYCAALISLIYGLSLVPEILGVIIALVGIGGLLIFVKWESIVHSPVLDFHIFRHNKIFVFSNASAMIISCASYALIFLLSLYLQYVKGFTAEIAGLTFLVLPVTQAVLAPLAGRLSDRIEPRIVATAGMVFTLLGLLILLFLQSNTPVLLICGILVILGIGLALFASPNTNAIMSSVTVKHYAVAASLANTARTLGNTLSMSITMIVFALVIGRITITSEYAAPFLTSLRVIFGIFAALCIFGIFASLARGDSHAEQ